MDSVVNFRMLATALFLIASGNPIQGLPKENGDEEKLRNAEERIFRHILKENPEFATYYSFHDYNDKLESFSLEAFQRRKMECNDILNSIKTINVSNLSSQAKLDYKFLHSFLETYLEGFTWINYGALTPLNFLDKTILTQSWVYRTEYIDEKDFEDYFKRMDSIPRRIDELIHLMKAAIRLNRTSHLASIDRLTDELQLFKIQASLFYPIKLKEIILVNHIPNDTWTEIRHKIQNKVTKQIAPSYKNFKRFIEEEYIPAARPKAGLSSLKDGIKYYEACLKWYFGYNITATEVYNLGVSETKRIAKKMKEVMSQLNFHGDLKEFFNHLKDIPEFYNISESKIIDEYRDIIQKRVNPVLFNIFHHVPLEEVRVAGVENNAPWGSYGRNVFRVNVRWPEDRSTFTMLPLTLHETNPGHHFQVSYSNANPIPKYRRLYLSGKYYAVPLALPNYAAFMEGWATYAEFLGEELNLYKDPYELFGRYCSEIFRAIRLIVDPGIHAFGWTREEAINFITNYTEFPIQQVEIEVDRYITWPGQACTYKIGELKIKELRSIAEKTLGNLFNIKDFHHQILKNGRISLALLEEVILEWIDKVKQSAADHSGGATVKWLSRRSSFTVMSTIFTSVLLTSYSHIYLPLNIL
ncbi:Hypothetical predicted protein [Octopus vulgaris]|uniref:DUF885 domain-containing protein n=1 Tax=Octopus vulgaris TaxID=6645 RepID=A0AA36BLW4_OCTVU|nr:Hypothetical predicted protein [Octopus vulgaris]